jgi:MarR family 2-MHQ and catechol resistance regulon transcriptional repressor
MDENRELALKLFVVLSKACKSMMDVTVKDMKKKGLSETEFTVLELLYHKGRFPLQRIGEKLLITSGGVTYTINKLENKGLLRRVACAEDRRVIYAEITETGRALFDRLFPSHAELIESIMQDLTVEEKRTAIALIKKIGYAAKEKAEQREECSRPNARNDG